MSEFDLISLMVEETMTMGRSDEFTFSLDEKRKCFVLKTSQVIEIPFGFGPFSENSKVFYIDSQDLYLYPLLCEIFQTTNVVYELSVEEAVCKVYDPAHGLHAA